MPSARLATHRALIVPAEHIVDPSVHEAEIFVIREWFLIVKEDSFARLTVL